MPNGYQFLDVFPVGNYKSFEAEFITKDVSQYVMIDVPGNAVGARFHGGDFRPAFHQSRIPGCGHADLLREKSCALHVVSAMNRIDSVDNRNAEPCLLCCCFLDLLKDVMPLVRRQRLL